MRQCNVDLYAQEFFFDADLPEFRDLGRQGFVYAADHSTTPWKHHELFGSVDQAEQTVGEFYIDIDAGLCRSLQRHYAHVIAPLDQMEHR